MSSEFLILMLALIPVMTRGLVGLVHRSLLGQRLRRSRQARDAAVTDAVMMSGFGYLGFMALTTINRNSSNVVEETALAFAIIGFVSCLWAGAVQRFNKWVVTDLVAETLMDIGSLCLLAALGTIIIEGNPDNALKRSAAIVMIVSLWASKHLERIGNSTTRYGEAALPHSESGQGKTGVQPG